MSWPRNATQATGRSGAPASRGHRAGAAVGRRRSRSRNVAFAHRAWRDQARPEQLPPQDPWQTLFFRGGRGSGKSWSGAHIFTELIFEDPLRETDGPGQWAIVAPTFGDARDKCIESDESGLLMALGTTTAEVEAGQSSRVAKWNRSLGELELRDGTRIYIDGADDGAYRIQGYNLRGAWCDEIGLWKRWRTSWDESLGFALRKGQARRVATGTPKRDQPARELVRRLLKDPAVVSRRLRTRDNLVNLSDAFVQGVLQRYQGTELGRQELDGELLEEAEGALWRQAWFEAEGFRVASPPYPTNETGEWQGMPVMGVDPSDGLEDGAEHALAVVGMGMDHDLYVTRSEGFRGVTPAAFARKAIMLAHRLGARVVIEKNHGGAWLEQVFRGEMNDLGLMVPVEMVSASQGKRTRAEPVSALYEQKRVHHAGEFPELESQQVSFTGAPGEVSPDRLDALVHAMTKFVGRSFKPAVPVDQAVHRYHDGPVPGVHRYTGAGTPGVHPYTGSLGWGGV